MTIRKNSSIKKNNSRISNQRSTTQKICFSLLTLSILLVVTETTLHLAGFRYIIDPIERFRLQSIEPHWQTRGLIRDPTLPWSWIPGPGMTANQPMDHSFTYNADGFIGPEYDKQKPGDSMRIICMGDSCTLGWNSPKNETYPDYLRKTLASFGTTQFQVINAGVSGYTSFQGLHDFHNRIRDWQPDILVISYNWNDHGDAPDQAGISFLNAAGERRQYPDKDQPSIPGIQVHESSLSKLRILQLFYFAHDKILERSGKAGHNTSTLNPVSPNRTPFPPGTGQRRVSIDDYRDNLIEFYRLAEQHGIQLIFLTQPANPVQHRHIQPWMTFYALQDQYNNVMRSVALDYKIPLADAANSEKWDEDKFYDHVHLQPAGNELVAQWVMKEILLSLVKK